MTRLFSSNRAGMPQPSSAEMFRQLDYWNFIQVGLFDFPGHLLHASSAVVCAIDAKRITLGGSIGSYAPCIGMQNSVSCSFLCGPRDAWFARSASETAEAWAPTGQGSKATSLESGKS